MRDIPITFFHRAATVCSEYHIVKAGTQFIVDGKKFPILGFSCGKDEAKTHASAKFELFERLYGHFIIARKKVPNELDKIRWYDKQKVGIELLENIAFRSGTGQKSDGTGMAYGTILEDAITNGLLELCERQLAADIWYEGRKIVFVKEMRVDLKDTLKIYALASSPGACFALAALHDTQRKIFVCGTALKLDPLAAQEHAIEEAVMLHDSLASQDQAVYQKEESKNHYSSLVGELAAQRMEHLASMVAEGQALLPDTTSAQLKDVVCKIFNPKYVYFSIVYQDDISVVIRGYADGAKTPSHYRNIKHIALSDPFC